jgi:hypothetical protein
VRSFYIPALSALITATEQNHQRVALLVKVDPVSRPMVNPQFTDPMAHWSDIARQSFQQSVDSGNNASPRCLITSALTAIA